MQEFGYTGGNTRPLSQRSASSQRGLRRGRPGLSWSSTIVISGIVTGDPIVETKTICDVRLALAPYCSAKMTVFAAAGIVIMTPLTSGSAKSREKSAGTTRRRTALADHLPRRQRRKRCGHPAREVDRIDERPWYIYRAEGEDEPDHGGRDPRGLQAVSS